MRIAERRCGAFRVRWSFVQPGSVLRLLVEKKSEYAVVGVKEPVVIERDEAPGAAQADCVVRADSGL